MEENKTITVDKKIQFTITPLKSGEPDLREESQHQRKMGFVLFLVRIHPEMGDDREDLRAIQIPPDDIPEKAVTLARQIAKKYKRAALIEIRPIA